MDIVDGSVIVDSSSFVYNRSKAILLSSEILSISDHDSTDLLLL